MCIRDSQYAWLGPLGTSLEKAEDYPLDLRPYDDKTKVLVTCGTQLPWAKENLLEQTKHLAKEHPECHFFVTLGDGAKDFSEEEVAPNVTVASYLPYKEPVSYTHLDVYKRQVYSCPTCFCR